MTAVPIIKTIHFIIRFLISYLLSLYFFMNRSPTMKILAPITIVLKELPIPIKMT